MSSKASQIQKNQPVVKCESVYKIFGENAEKMLLESEGDVDAKKFQDAGCVVGVNSASFEVYKAKCLLLWVCQVQANLLCSDASPD